MSAFNPDLFLQAESSEALSTVLTPVPEGEFPGVIKSITPRVVGEKGTPVLDVVWTLDSPEVKAATGIDNSQVRQSLWLDVTDSGGLDFSKGKNVSLGRLREALGQNKAGKPWSPNMLIGGSAKVKVVHTFDKNDSSIIYANVNSVAKL